jgi:UTP-glucose-1-phosphate uridylyltransferase
MAAGMGSRYGGLKQIDPVGPSGEIVLDYSVYDAIRAGFGKVVFIIRPEIDAAFKEVIGQKLDGKIGVEIVFQTLEKIPAKFPPFGNRTKPWGTGQAVLMAKPVVHEPFAVINAADFYGRESFEILAKQLMQTDPESLCLSMVGFYIKNTLSPYGGVARGYCDVHAGKLQHIAERFNIQRSEDGAIRYDGGEMPDDAMVSMNTWGFTPRLFDALEHGFEVFLESKGAEPKSEFYLLDVVDHMIQTGAGTVDVLPTNEKWMGVTYAEDKPQVMAGIRAMVAAGVYPENLWG